MAREHRYDVESLSHRHPWVVSFVFGLLHGFGFAGALADIGLPESALATALLSFNLGVEIGQLVFVAVLGGMAWLGSQMLERLHPPLTRRALDLALYTLGGVSAYWTLERTLRVVAGAG